MLSLSLSRALSLALGSSLLVATIHCGDDATPAPGPGASGPATASAAVIACFAAVDEVEAARCEAELRINNTCNPSILGGHYRRRAIETLISGGVSCDLEGGKACMAALAAVTTEAALYEAFRACDKRPVLAPETPVGQRCYDRPDQCKGSYCALDAACFGTCKAFQKVGDSCAVADRCGEGLRCGYESRRCEVPVPAPQTGDACDVAKNDCGGQDRCHEKTKVCTTQLAAGKSCTADPECVSFRCGETKVCEGSAENGECNGPGGCVAGLTCAAPPSGSGARICRKVPADYCERGDEFRCPAGSYCSQANACVARATSKEGEPCVNGSCGVGLYCSDDKCIKVAGGFPKGANVGEACALPKDCDQSASLVCTAGKCQRAIRAGAACDAAADACDAFTYCGPAKTCVPRLVAGTACTRDHECEGDEKGTCEAGVCKASCDQDL